MTLVSGGQDFLQRHRTVGCEQAFANFSKSLKRSARVRGIVVSNPLQTRQRPSLPADSNRLTMLYTIKQIAQRGVGLIDANGNHLVHH